MIELSPTPSSSEPTAVLILHTAPKPDRVSRIASIAFALALLTYVLLIALPYLEMPVPTLLNWVADDAFYYLQIARHIAQNGVSSFDGITRTNGYHPLWMLSCTLLALIFHDKATLLRAALCLTFVCYAATGLLLTRLLKPYTGDFWSKIGGAAWLFNPLALHLCLCLTEAPLYILCLTAALLGLRNAFDSIGTASPFEETRSRPTSYAAAQVGSACGAALLARTDAICFIAPALICLTIRAYKAAPREARLSHAAATFLIPAAVCAAMFSPWLVYSWANVHTFAQDSGVMKSLWQAAQEHAAHATLAERFSGAARFTLSDWLQRTLNVTLQLPWIAGTLLTTSVTALALLAAFLLRSEALHRQMLAATALLAIATVGMGFVYGYGVSDHQVWHLAEPALAIWLVLFAWIGALAASKTSARYTAVLGSSFLAATACLGIIGARNFAPHYPWQVDVYRSQPVLEQMVPSGERIGCFNAGIPAYFSDRAIVNLDGLVNHDAVPYWKSHRFANYLADAHINYIIDEPDAVSRARAFSDKRLNLTVVASGPLIGWNPPVRYLLCITPNSNSVPLRKPTSNSPISGGAKAHN